MAMEMLRRVSTSLVPPHVELINQRLSQLMALPKVPAAHPSQLPAAWMRSGTSKGLYVKKIHLPPHEKEWAPILSSALGSANGDKRQLDGIGGASSTTSKVAIVAPSSREDADVDYTFAQVGVGQNKVDLKGSCGNVCAGVGPFAVDEGMVRVQRGSPTARVRINDTNTGALIEQHLRINPATGRFEPDGDFKIPGYAGSGSPITLSWKKAAGTVGRRQLFPSGNRADIIKVKDDAFDEPIEARATLIDAANPFVFVDADSLPMPLIARGSDDPAVMSVVESIRCHAAVRYGLAETPEEAHKTRAIPKVVLLHQPPSSSTSSDKSQADVRVVAYSMGKPHPSFQLTGVLCLSAALTYPGTVPAAIAQRARGQDEPAHAAKLEPPVGEVAKVVAHPSGIARAVVTHDRTEDGTPVLDKISVTTTAQRLFTGLVDVGKAGVESRAPNTA